MIGDTVHQAWMGDRPVPGFINEWKKLCEANGFKHRLWGLGECLRMIERHGMNHVPRLFINQPDYSGISDLSRYAILMEHGGIWMDADMMPFQWFREEMINGDAMWVAYESERHCGNMIATCAIGAPAGHQIVKELIRRCGCIKSINLNSWQVTGPGLMTKVIHDYGKADGTVRIYPSHLFCPYHHKDTEDQPLHDDCIAIHHWGSMWAAKKMVIGTNPYEE